MIVPFFDYKNVFEPYKNDILNITKNIIESGQFIFGEDLKNFEIACAARTGSKYAVGVGNATDALEILLMAHDMPEGSEIIISSHTMNATASAIVTAGGIPVPVDIDEYGMLDPKKIEDAITSDTWALMPTQLNGAIAQMDQIKRVANQHGLYLFEDSAQAFTAELDGVHAGNFGNGGVFSFYPAKILGCLGDGGIIVVNSKDIFDKAMTVRDHGRGADGASVLPARNSRLDNLQAAYLNYFLSNHFDGWIEKRRIITEFYDDAFSNLKQVNTPLYNTRSGHKSVYQNYELLADRRDELRNYLKENNIGTLIQWGGQSIHENPNFCEYKRLANTEKYFQKCLMLPLNQTMTLDDADYVVQKVYKFFGVSQ